MFKAFRDWIVFSVCILVIGVNSATGTSPYKPYIITVKDSVTGRGIPLVELKTTNKILFYTDADGQVAFYEPGLMDQDVYFHIHHFDYYKPADYFGNQGQALTAYENGSGEILVGEITTGQSGCWTLNDGAGTTAAEWMHGFDGTLVNGVTWLVGGGVKGTGVDHALLFDGVNDYMRLPCNIDGDFSIAFYMKTTQIAPSGTQWYNGNGIIDADVPFNNNDFGISLNGNKACFGIGNPDTSIMSTSAVNDGNWHFIVATRDASNGQIALYVDTFKEATASANSNLLDAPTEINVGRQLPGVMYFAGTIDQISIYDHAMSPAEVYTLASPAFDPASQQIEPFVIKITDAETGRGVPLVRLQSDCGPEYFSDSAGVVTLYEPAFMNRNVHFEVFSYGYQSPVSGGFTAYVESNGQTEISIKRINIAERLYRITGGGIYHHSTLAELKIPLANPNLSGKVLGQDTVDMTEYNGQYFWLWGDTVRPAYPLGNFKTSSATSQLQRMGGLDPSFGVDLTYFVNGEGFSKEMFPRSDAGLVWMNTLAAVDDTSIERLIGSYAVISGAAEGEKGIAIFNDTTEVFETLTVFQPSHNIVLSGQAHKKDGYIYVNCPYPTIRIPATLSGIQNPAGYEAFTCLVPGTAYDGASSQVERDGSNNLAWDWKQNTSPIDDGRWKEMVNSGLVTQDEAWNWLEDTESGDHVLLAGASAGYNPYLDCWVMVGQQQWGTSFLGEAWVSAAPAPEGPWTKARKIVTHTSPEAPYTFYNVAYHPEFNQNNGRFIYLEGTYVTTYSGNENPTARYDYNQIMYRVDLADARLDDIWPPNIPERLLAYWPFNDNGGSVAVDSSGNGFDGQLVNMDATSWTSGKQCGGLTFDGVDDYVKITGYKGIAGGASRACTAWIKTSQVSDEILAWGNLDNGGKWIIRVNEGGQLHAEVQGGKIIGTTLINDNNWHHIAVVLDNDGSPDISEAQLYVDGQLESVSVVEDEPVNTAAEQDVAIGVFTLTGIHYFQGLIDEVRIYNYPLSATEIQEIYQQYALVADTEPDGDVDLNDFAVLASFWLVPDSCGLDLTCYCVVDLADVIVLIDEWLTSK